jgi:tricorn protease
MKKIWALALGLCFSSTLLQAQDTPLWMRYPAISPDGKTIAFGYKGDIYRVPVSGGVATPLTIHEAHDMMPIWSHDGKYIAFASDRHGNFDVYVMPSTGGAPVRLTYNSAGDYPYDFSPDDQSVIFGSARNSTATSIRFSILLFRNLYKVSVKGGRPVLISAAGMENAHFNSKGTQIVFQDTKGYEDEWRKHHTSAVTKDVWLYDIASGKYTQISQYKGEDREPLFGSDDKTVYYLSEQNGTQNLFKTTTSGGTAQELTDFKTNPVRHLSRSADNTFCFTWNGEIYTYKEGGQPVKVPILIENDGRQGVDKNLPINGNVTEFTVSPNGKEVAFVSRGEVFVTSVEGTQTKRITNTPQQERMVQWAPDGRSLIYATERGDSWDIYKASIVRKEEPYFYASTIVKEEPVIATDADEYQPKYSPDGKQIAYIEERNILKVYNLDTKKTITILPEGHNHSYADGDWDFAWSPDNKWIITDDQRNYFGSSHAALIKADGSGSIIYPVNSGFGENNNKWVMGGKAMTWSSGKEGRKSIANQGSREEDVYAVFFDQDAFDRFKLSKEDYDLLKEKEKDAKKDTTKNKELKLDLTNLENRKIRLTINSSSLADYVLSPDGDKLYYLAAFEKGFDLWVTEPRTRETKILAKLGASPSGIEISKDGKSLFVSSNGGLMKIDAESGRPTPIGINGEMDLDLAAERTYIFEHAWRQVKKKLYDPKMGGVDWEAYKATYARFLPHISDNYDFQELLSEMLGELNVSHSGGRYFARNPNPDRTASLGLFYDETYSGNGLKITEVIQGGPVDKASDKIKAGNIIEKIDGNDITDDVDWARWLNLKAGENTLLSVYDPSTGTRWDESVRPISPGEESGLLYTRWTKRMKDMVEKLSGGQIGYVHVEGMDDGSYREVIDEVMGKNRDKKALIVDTRFNGGGWLHDDLNTFLSGKHYLSFAPQGHLLNGGESASRWDKPSCVLMSESNYSDAFIFPYSYKALGIGKLIGMPVAGTGTAVWWEAQIDPTIIFGIPMIATIGKEGRPTENLQVEPDIRVPLPYEDFLSGKDTQLEAAVKEMLSEIGEK